MTFVLGHNLTNHRTTSCGHIGKDPATRGRAERQEPPPVMYDRERIRQSIEEERQRERRRNGLW
ncbi:hypothetical protein [Nocardioides panacisoli]|uniref:Uncharacterized protein n=1 Tax=Nocardioides panacisoli TaxID=627624 RepID=A0ABP7IGM6_9ACTN